MDKSHKESLRNGVSLILPYSGLLLALAAKLGDGLPYLLGPGMIRIIHHFWGGQ
jgi:hypothetical protein